MSVLFNADIVSTEAVSFATNRAFRYGDACFETIRLHNGKPLFWEDHQNRLLKTLQALEMDVPDELKDVRFFEMLCRLAQENKMNSSGRLRLTCFRNGAGLYASETNVISYVGEVQPLEGDGYVLNEKGLTVSFYDEIKKPLYLFSSFKTTNCLLQVVASEYRKNKGLDDLLLINAAGDIAEAISSNVFVVKDGMFFTTATDEGCIPGVMRYQIMSILAEEGVFTLEGCVTKQMVMEADEVFLTNVVKGIQWVRSCDGVEFSNELSKELVDRLNDLIS